VSLDPQLAAIRARQASESAARWAHFAYFVGWLRSGENATLAVAAGLSADSLIVHAASANFVDGGALLASLQAGESGAGSLAGVGALGVDTQ
jgi:hypothetical protein